MATTAAVAASRNSTAGLRRPKVRQSFTPSASIRMSIRGKVRAVPSDSAPVSSPGSIAPAQNSGKVDAAITAASSRSAPPSRPSRPASTSPAAIDACTRMISSIGRPFTTSTRPVPAACAPTTRPLARVGTMLAASTHQAAARAGRRRSPTRTAASDSAAISMVTAPRAASAGIANAASASPACTARKR